MDHHHQKHAYRTSKREPTYHKFIKVYMVKTLFFIVLILITFTFLLLPHIVRSKKPIPLLSRKYVRYSSDLKYVLIWKDHHEEKPLVIGQKMFVEQRCPDINCFFTYNKNLLDGDVTNFDAIVFNVQDVIKAPSYKLRLPRSSHQRYIFRSLQPAAKYPLCGDHFENFFNLTWTYKLDSDIPHPFFNVYNALNKVIGPKPFVDWLKVMKHNNRIVKKIQTKTKAVSLIMNKCKSTRQQDGFVEEFNKALKGYNYSVDIYGACAQHKCPEEKLWKCYKMMENDYYFNLVLEDYISEDYLTDNIVKTMAHNTLPIVLAKANFDRFLPPGSYIKVQDHDMNNLAAIVDHLIKQPVKYSYFFDWKNYYYLTEKPSHHVCTLCAKLNERTESKPALNGFRWWWNPLFEQFCQLANDNNE